MPLSGIYHVSGNGIKKLDVVFQRADSIFVSNLGFEPLNFKLFHFIFFLILSVIV